MFSSITAFLLTAVTIFPLAISDNLTDVDKAVRCCRISEKRFADNEDKYVKKLPRLPVQPELSDKPFTREQPTGELEQMQRKFECIGDKEFNDQELLNSEKYQSLVNRCKAVQPTSPRCDNSYPYRIINGTCNNLYYPRWGSTFSCFWRLWPANYEGVSGLRKSVKGNKPLPNAREISRALVQNKSNRTTDYNTLFAYIGQVMAHDLGQFPFTMVNGSKKLGCCEHALDKDQHPQCIPILLDPTDLFYSAQNVHCFNVVRVIPCITCSVGKRMPINYVTPWLDLSLVYGQTDERAQKLRRKDGTGKLKSHYTESGELLQLDPSKGSRCGDILLKKEYCFQSGDTRVDQHTILMIFQTLFLREHNRIADRLKQLNPQWDDERLYQEARKILIAEWHVIIYKEYLPILLGPKLMSRYGLNMGDGSTYNPSVDPSISVEFNGAAFRVHSILPGRVVYHEQIEWLQHLFLNAEPIYENRTSSYLYKMANNAAEKHDRFLPNDLTIWMYRERAVGTWGFDLTAIDIQRGRDVGLPSYAQTIEYMDNRPIRTFLDLKDYIIPECLTILPKIYDDVRDIDLQVGILCEKVPYDMIIPNTAAHIIADQFWRSKVGDRFYFENDGFLTYEQRKTLMNASLSKLICDNTDIGSLQPNSMLLQSPSNKAQRCSEITGVDLDKWKE